METALKAMVREAIAKEMSSVGSVGGYQGGDWYHGENVDKKKGVYSSDVDARESKYPRKKGKKKLIGSGPQGDKHFSTFENIQQDFKQKINEFIDEAMTDDLLYSDLTPNSMSYVQKAQKKLSDLQVDINSSFAHSQEFLKLGIKTHREIEFKRLSVESKRLLGLVNKYKNLAEQLAKMAGDVHNRTGLKDLQTKMMKQAASEPEQGGPQ